MSELAYKVKPRRRVLVKMLPIAGDHYNPHGLTLVDKKKHFEHAFRRAKVVSMDPAIAWHIPDVMPGDVVIIRGDSGFTTDGDVLDEDDKYEEPLKGEFYRWMHWKELLAIEEN